MRPRAFQVATIAAALRTLNGAFPRRFLVADEVGLGKTVVAGGVINRLMIEKRERGEGPICVLYVCSNLAIAHQNMDRLLTFIETKDERKTAIGKIDRPSLLPTQSRPVHRDAHIYQLTPATAVPTRKGQSRDGRKEERALAFVLILRIAPTISRRRLCIAFKRNAHAESFKHCANRYVSEELGGREFRIQFRQALRELLELQEGQHLPPRLNEYLRDRRRHPDLVALARTALAIAALRNLKPDLVIFDEFQRFRDLAEDNDTHQADSDLDPVGMREDAASRVLQAIRGDGRQGSPRLLLLSATPYTPYRSRSERGVDDDGDQHNSDFFELVSFLANDQARPKGQRVSEHAARLFSALRNELQRGDISSEVAMRTRRELVNLLRPLMARTERTSVGLPQAKSAAPEIIGSALQAIDLAPVVQMRECFREEDWDWIVPLWQSVPLPIQTLGSRYKAWHRKRKMPAPDALDLPKRGRDRYEPNVAPSRWPHPKLRALLSKVINDSMTMPWARPSLCWWPLQGGWKTAGNEGFDEKLLVFSRFRAVPTAMSGLLSYALEHRFARSTDYEAFGKQRLKPSNSLLLLFHPSPLLAELDPLCAGIGDLGAIRTDMERQLRERLSHLKVRVVRERRPGRKIWDLLAALEKLSGTWTNSLAAWKSSVHVRSNVDGEAEVVAMLENWDGKSTGTAVDVSLPELKELARLALEAPGVVLLRALQRHWQISPGNGHLKGVVDVVWNGLRNYLSQPWFPPALKCRTLKQYPAALRQAVIDGGLESVLDEHLWFLSGQSENDLPAILKEMAVALRLRDASVTFHESEVGDRAEGDGSFRQRCHFAVPLTEAKVSGDLDSNAQEAIRPDLVRKAFNSPFWPRVLVTTSIGQEGLDLHPWCNSLVHWDLASGPVALEQREGRITRFGGLAIRRAIAGNKTLQERMRTTRSTNSPWRQLANLADSELADASELSPWWVLEGANCINYLVSTAGSEQRRRCESLNQERALYRLVLGIPDQDDLLRVLKVKFAEEQDPERLSAIVRNACIDLCAYNLDGGDATAAGDRSLSGESTNWSTKDAISTLS